MQNLIKTNCVENLVFRNGYEMNSPLGSEWDISAATGNIQGPNTTNKVGTGGSGSGLQFLFTTDSTPSISKVTITKPGKNYKAGDVITFSFTSADNIATGSFDITLTLPADLSTLPSTMALNNSKDLGGTSNAYMDASKVIGWYSNEGSIVRYLTKNRDGSGDDMMEYKIAFSGVDSNVPADEHLLNEIACVISHCFRDAWQEPNSMFILNDYIKSYIDADPNLGIINITLEEAV